MTVVPKQGFRADINGLRAIAVLAVLLFHFGVPGLSGGFVGVDVFFVISGYLMTGIIIKRIDRGTFSILGFYLDRAQRIIPALAVLIAAVLALGWFILLPDEYIVLSKHSATSATFLSNILYWTESGYFDTGADQKWLLHTWSLSVEWQFYILYPLLMFVLTRVTPRRLWAPLLGGAAVLSAALMLWCSATRPVAGFFLLPPRAWEMLVGGLVFLAPALSPRLTRIAQVAGLALIGAAIVTTSGAGWPNAWAFVPAAGTALVIAAARTDSQLTGNAVARWIGLNSYSIYLWHWPVVVLLRRSPHAADPVWILGSIAASLILGHLSWRFVERIAQRDRGQPKIHTAPAHGSWRQHAALALPVLAVAVASTAVWKARGVPQRFSEAVRMAAEDAAPRPVPGAAPCFAGGDALPVPCVLGPAKAPVLAALIGDSHADAALAGFLAAIPAQAQGGVVFNAYRACPPVLGAQASGPNGGQCGAFIERFLQPYTAKRTTPLVLIGSWITHVEGPDLTFPGGSATPTADDYLANLYRSSCRLAAAGPTYAVLPTPQFGFGVAHELQYRLMRDPNAPDIAIPLADHLATHRPVIAALQRAARDCGLRLLDPAPYLCPAGKCMGSQGHRAIIRDASHFTAYGAGLLTPMYAPVFAQAPRP